MDNDDESRNWIPHPKYYDPQCGPYPIFRAGNTLFKFTLPPFMLHSEVMKDLYANAPFTYDDGKPIFLANLTAEEFERVLAWLWHECVI
ncbi:hypothetical protein C8J55DRAFT_557741 [Lentinula edodes]|uniref:BTB domain-containing protein n=1 Tax=Lentinula lateritia TaxID=40482 RepID=A0A9W9ASV7_9AGAR|nr:hypothetical protein C8J55DRAFT_557741 [Lentinula edodes]